MRSNTEPDIMGSETMSDPGLIDVGAHHNIFVRGARPADEYYPVMQVLELNYHSDKDHYRYAYLVEVVIVVVRKR